MNLHELFTLMILPRGTSRINEIQYMKYTSECIPKLQIRQHSLLTRRHSLDTIHHHKSSSLDQVQIIIKVGSSLDHHQNWIIIKAGSSLDHHQIWIKTGSSSSLLPLYLSTGAISQFYSPQKVLQSQPFFMLVVGLASMQVFFSTYI